MTWVLPWLIALGLAGPATADPGAAAVAFLEDVRHGRLTAERIDQTALSRFAGKDKRAELGRRLTALAATFNPQLPLAVEATKVDDDLAGVVVCQNSPLDPAGPRLFTVAMVLRDGVWMPAPAPGSFENTLYGYDPATARRAADLEHWMMRERATRGTALRDHAAASLRAQLAGHIPPGELRVDNPAAIVRRFLAACADRDLNAALTLLGGLEDPPPDDWAFRHRAAFAGLGPDARDPLAARWRLLAHPQVARAILATEDDPAGRDRTTVWLGCLDPAATRLSAPASDPTARPVRIPLRLVRAPDRAWRIDLPPLMVEPPQPRQPDDPFARNLDWYSRLAEECEPHELAGFPQDFRSEHPPEPAPDHATLRTRFLERLNQGDFPGLLRLFAPADNGPTALVGYERTAALWRELHREGRRGAAVFLGDLCEETTAAAAIHLFLARRPEQPHVRTIRSVRNQAGWLLAPALADLQVWRAADAADDPAPKPVPDPLATRVTDSLPAWEAGAAAATLAPAERLDGPPADPPPTPEAATASVLAWRQAVLAGHLDAATRTAALFAQADSPGRFLRALGHEFVGGRRNPDPGTVVAAGCHGRWAAVSLRINGDEGPVFPFYPVAAGTRDARVLPEVDLFHLGGRTRKFLNQQSWAALRKHLPQPAVDELRELFDRHEQLARQTPGPPPTAPDTPAPE